MEIKNKIRERRRKALAQAAVDNMVARFDIECWKLGEPRKRVATKEELERAEKIVNRKIENQINYKTGVLSY